MFDGLGRFSLCIRESKERFRGSFCEGEDQVCGRAIIRTRSLAPSTLSPFHRIPGVVCRGRSGTFPRPELHHIGDLDQLGNMCILRRPAGCIMPENWRDYSKHPKARAGTSGQRISRRRETLRSNEVCSLQAKTLGPKPWPGLGATSRDIHMPLCSRSLHSCVAAEFVV